MKPIFDKYNPAFPFEYQFADEQYAKKFNYEELVGNLAAIIAVLAIFISCLGLLDWLPLQQSNALKRSAYEKCWVQVFSTCGNYFQRILSYWF